MTKILLIFSLVLTYIPDVISQVVCTNSDLSAGFTKLDNYGTKDGGYSLSCENSATGSYNLYLWRLEKFNGATFDTVYTYFDGATDPGTNYKSRNLSWKNNNTVVFPTMIPSDVGLDTYKCTVQWNSIAFECTDSKVLKINAKPVVTYQPYCPSRGKEEAMTVIGVDFLTYDLAATQYILNINGNNNTLQTTVTSKTDGFQTFNSSTPVTFNDNTVMVSVFMVVGDSSADVEGTSLTTTVVPDATPYLVTVVIMEILVVIIIVVLVLLVDKDGPGMVIRWILFISSITVGVFGLVFVILISVEACKPLESMAIAAIVLSALAIPLGIVGLVLTFKLKSYNNDWIRCKPTKE